jgi:hypothetical protein
MTPVTGFLTLPRRGMTSAGSRSGWYTRGRLRRKKFPNCQKKQYKEAADQGRAARRTGLQAMRNQRGQPQRGGNKHDQAGPVDKGISALLESHRCGGNGDAAMQFADERRIGFI